MKIFRHIDGLKPIKNAVITTGSFDGVHAGHKAIIDRVNKLAGSINGESVLITFYPHPRKVLFPDSEGKDLKLISSQSEKIELLRQTGLGNLVVINFTIEFSRISSYDFVKDILIGKLDAAIIVVGFNHHFGYNRQGDYHFLYELKDKFGIQVEEIPEIEIQHETVSSTKIRKAITDGNIRKANAYLDHFYTVKVIIKKTDLLKNNIYTCYKCMAEEEDKLLPPPGAYAVSLTNHGERMKCLFCIFTGESGRNNLYLVMKGDFEIKDELLTIEFHMRLGDIAGLDSDKDFELNISGNWKRIAEMIY